MEHELPKSVVMVMARCLALKAVKAELRRSGLRFQSFEQRDLSAMAYRYWDEHPELIAQAEEMIATTPSLRKIAERERKRHERKPRAKMRSDAQSARPCSTTGIPVQNSCSQWSHK
jgi:hypothetical protein